MYGALKCPQKVDLIVHGSFIIINYYCPQKVGLIVHGPYMYCQLLSSESGPQCVGPLSVLRKQSSLCAALILSITVLRKLPQCVWPLRC